MHALHARHQSQPTVTNVAAEHAHVLLSNLSYLARATEEGGQASELHLHHLLDSALGLLYEVGGFDDVLADYWLGTAD